MKDEDFYTMIEQLIDAAFDTQLGKKKEKLMEQPLAPEDEAFFKVEELLKEDERLFGEVGKVDEVDESIEAYTARTGKRFRMLKDQKARGLTREEAFTETFGGTN